MKVKEVIIDLQRLDPELEVVIGAESTYFSPTMPFPCPACGQPWGLGAR
jgi:hypothetical protein